jgi:hypothetical protein
MKVHVDTQSSDRGLEMVGITYLLSHDDAALIPCLCRVDQQWEVFVT